MLCLYQSCIEKHTIGVAQCLVSIKYNRLQIDTHDTSSVSAVCSVGGHERRRKTQESRRKDEIKPVKRSIALTARSPYVLKPSSIWPMSSNRGWMFDSATPKTRAGSGHGVLRSFLVLVDFQKLA